MLQLSAVDPTTSSPAAYDFNTAGLGVAAYNPDQDPSTLNQRGTWGGCTGRDGIGRVSIQVCPW